MAKKNALALIQKLSPEQLSLPNNDGDTPLHRAIAAVEKEIALALVQKLSPEQLSLKNNYNKTPLHYAISPGQPEVVQALFAHGVSPRLHVLLKDSISQDVKVILRQYNFEYLPYNAMSTGHSLKKVSKFSVGDISKVYEQDLAERTKTAEQSTNQRR